MNPDCLATLFTLLCNQPVMPGEWPSAKIIHVPPAPITAESIEREHEWLEICKPVIVTGRDGVGRYRYSLACPDGVPINTVKLVGNR